MTNVETDEMRDEADMAESELRRLGLAGVRVRPLGTLARLAVPEDDLAAIARDPLRAEVVRAVRGAGFAHVVVDLDPAR